SASPSNASQTTGSAPNSRSRSSFPGERVIPATSCPAATSSGTSRTPITPLAPATKTRISEWPRFLTAHGRNDASAFAPQKSRVEADSRSPISIGIREGDVPGHDLLVATSQLQKQPKQSSPQPSPADRPGTPFRDGARRSFFRLALVEVCE